MSIDALTDIIIQEAEKEAVSIKDGVNQQLLKIEEEASKKADSLIHQMIEKANEQAYREQEKRIISANLERKKAILEEKQSAISSVFDTVLKDIHQLDKVKFQAIIENMLEGCEGDEEIIIDTKEDRIDNSFIEAVNIRLNEKGKKGNLKLSEKTRDIPGGGFMLRKGHIEKNCSFVIYLDSLRKELESRISDILLVLSEE